MEDLLINTPSIEKETNQTLFTQDLEHMDTEELMAIKDSDNDSSFGSKSDGVESALMESNDFDMDETQRMIEERKALKMN